jgi:hypothetical protein
MKQHNPKIKCNQVYSETMKLQNTSLSFWPQRGRRTTLLIHLPLPRQNSRFVLISKQIHGDNDWLSVNNSPGKQTHVSNTITWTQAAGNKHTQRSIKLTTFVSAAVLICNGIRIDVPQFKNPLIQLSCNSLCFSLIHESITPPASLHP